MGLCETIVLKVGWSAGKRHLKNLYCFIFSECSYFYNITQHIAICRLSLNHSAVKSSLE